MVLLLITTELFVELLGKIVFDLSLVGRVFDLPVLREVAENAVGYGAEREAVKFRAVVVQRADPEFLLQEIGIRRFNERGKLGGVHRFRKLAGHPERGKGERIGTGDVFGGGNGGRGRSFRERLFRCLAQLFRKGRGIAEKPADPLGDNGLVAVR